MQTELNRQPDKTIELTVTIPWAEVKKTNDKVVEEALKTIEVKGFRKGKAPHKLAEEKLDKEKVWQKVIELVLPDAYSGALKKEDIKPIISPQIQLIKAVPENDLVFKAVTAETPDIKLGDYKKALKSVKKTSPKIWTPDSQKIKTRQKAFDHQGGQASKDQKNNQKKSLDQIIGKLLEVVKITIPKILLEQQTHRNLIQLLDQVKQLGMTIQQYAESKGETVEQIKENAKKEAEAALKLEFILEKIADVEKITIENKEIDEMINKTKDEKQRKNLQNQRYYIASLLRRQKTLQTFLA